MRWDSISMSLCVLISLRNLILTHPLTLAPKRTNAKVILVKKKCLFILLGIGIYPLALLIHRFHFERKSYQPGNDNESTGSVDLLQKGIQD